MQQKFLGERFVLTSDQHRKSLYDEGVLLLFIFSYRRLFPPKQKLVILRAELEDKNQNYVELWADLEVFKVFLYSKKIF